MRRRFVLVAGLGLLHAGTGCNHIAGFCDCAPPIQPCCMYGLYPAGYAAPAVAPPPVHAEVAPPPPAEAVPPPIAPPPPPPPAKEPVMKERIGLPREL
jgi:hypothetical protein